MRFLKIGGVQFCIYICLQVLAVYVCLKYLHVHIVIKHMQPEYCHLNSDPQRNVGAEMSTGSGLASAIARNAYSEAPDSLN